MTGNENLQDVLWMPAGPMFWRGMACVAALNVALLFRALLKNHDRNALTYARLLWLGGAISAMGIPFNSGLQIWSLAMIITAGAWMSVLIETGWCHRRGTWIQKVAAIASETIFGHKRPNGAD